MVNKNFTDLMAHGGINERKTASCIKARYNAGVTNFKDDNSGVLVAFTDEDIRLENWGGRTWLVV